MSPNDKEALTRLEEEKERRILERVAAGQAVFVGPIICGVERDEPVTEGQRDASGREMYYGTVKRDGTVDRTDTIITGVPRAGRDAEDAVERLVARAKQAGFPSDPIRAQAAKARDEASQAPQAPPEPELEPEFKRVRVTIDLPTDTSLGAVVDGFYFVQDDMVYVQDALKRPLGRLALNPGDNPEIVARRVLKSKHCSNNFYRKISYPRSSIH
jgi:hypothetical protein